MEHSLPEALGRQRSRLEADVVTWARAHFYIEVGRTIDPLPHQEALLRLFSRRRPDGRAWRNQLFSTVKKSGKTTIAALLTRHDAETGPPGREIYLAANDKEQATNRVFQAIRRSIELHPDAGDQWEITAHELRHVSGTFIRAIASDYRGEAGANPSRTVFTELWGYEREQARRLYEELTPVPTVESVRLVETSAGYEGESGLLGDLHALGKAGRQLTAGEFAELTDSALGVFAEASDAGDLVPVWINDAAGMVMYWDEGTAARRMPWQQGSEGAMYYAEQEQTLRPSQFRRLHLNEWAQAEEAFLPIGWWDACREDLPELDAHTAMVIGVDGAVSGDSFAVVGVTRHPERPDDVAVRMWGVWKPPPGGQINFAEPFGALVHQCKNYDVVQIAFDPFQLADFMQRLYRAAEVWTEPFNQGPDRNMADKRLYDVIRDRRLAHCGPPEIREHLLNADVKVTEDSKIRIVKRSERGKVDLAVAMSMAVDQCLFLNL